MTPGCGRAVASVITSHAPLTQAFSQANAHVPQWVTSFARSTSQPSAGSALQSPKPGSQTRTHFPAEQSGASWAAASQATPQAPQLSMLVESAPSQPLPGSPSQSAKPGGHGSAPASSP